MDLINRVATKQNARAYIGADNRWLYMFATMLPLTIATSCLSSINSVSTTFSNLSNGRDPEAVMFVSAVTSIFAIIGGIAGILLIPFNTGIAGYFLNHVRGFNPEWKSPYVEGKEHYSKYLEVGFVTGIIIFLWGLLFIIPGIIKAYSYSMVEYIIHDNPNLSNEDARRISDLMTKGHKGELFVKDMSFIAWFLLVGCTCGLAGAYVLPYVRTVGAMYYEGLKDNAIRTGLVSAASFGVAYAAPEAPQSNNGFGNYQQYSAPQSNAQPTVYQPYTPPVNPEPKPEQRTIILNGEEYKPDSNNPKGL